jgi:hypothetical protein
MVWLDLQTFRGLPDWYRTNPRQDLAQIAVVLRIQMLDEYERQAGIRW